MSIFKFGKLSRENDDSRIEDMPSEHSIEETLSELGAESGWRTADRAKSDVKEALSHAALADIRGIAMMERGRCPECGARTRAFLFAWACPSCGWFLQFDDRYGRCVVELDNGEKIECDCVFHVKGDEMLCVEGDVIVSRLAKSCVRRIDYIWNNDELRNAQEQSKKERSGTCGWCEIALSQLEDEKAPYEEYVAFGAFQERYLFCSDKCLHAFRKQYSVRVHRNCYETDCNACDACIKRYDTRGFKRRSVAEEK